MDIEGGDDIHHRAQNRVVRIHLGLSHRSRMDRGRKGRKAHTDHRGKSQLDRVRWVEVGCKVVGSAVQLSVRRVDQKAHKVDQKAHKVGQKAHKVGQSVRTEALVVRNWGTLHVEHRQHHSTPRDLCDRNT